MALYILVLLASLLILILFQGELRKLRLARKSWDELLKEVRTVNIEGITLAALECDPETAFAPDEVWMMIGGWEGLKRMQANAELLIALAAHAPTWKAGECPGVAGQMWCDARAIQNTVRRIRLQRIFRKGYTLSPDTLGTVCAYHRMSDCLLRLFERSPSRRYYQLTAVVWPV